MNTHSYAGLEIGGGDNGDGAALLSKLPFKTLLHRHWKREQKINRLIIYCNSLQQKV